MNVQTIAHRQVSGIAELKGWVSKALRSAGRAHRQRLQIAASARNARTELGFEHVPLRVWNRRSALLINTKRQ